MSITVRQAEDLLAANYGGHWSWDDPEWWFDMVEHLTTNYRSIRHLRRENPNEWIVPWWWPGAGPRPARAGLGPAPKVMP